MESDKIWMAQGCLVSGTAYNFSILYYYRTRGVVMIGGEIPRRFKRRFHECVFLGHIEYFPFGGHVWVCDFHGFLHVDILTGMDIMGIMTKFDLLYRDILKRILADGTREVNRRTGLEVAALPGISFSIDLEKDGFPLLTLRKIPLKMFIAEQVWFISGSRKPADFLRNHTKIWDLFTNPGDVVTVAYGYRWRKHFGRDQLGKLIAMLEKDPSSRHGVIITWDPASDGLGGIAKKNIPCPFTFTVNIMDGRLNLHNIIRSNDMVLGMPADAAGFALLAHMLADRLNVRPGIYTHSISHAHIYSNHYDGAGEIIRRKNNHKPIQLHLPPRSFARAEKKDDSLVEEIFRDLASQYSPQKPIAGLTIAL